MLALSGMVNVGRLFFTTTKLGRFFRKKEIASEKRMNFRQLLKHTWPSGIDTQHADVLFCNPTPKATHL